MISTAILLFSLGNLLRSADKKIVVQNHYSNDDYKFMLRTTMRSVFAEQKAPVGIRKYLEEVIEPVIVIHSERIVLENGIPVFPNVPPLIENHKTFWYYLSDDPLYRDRKFNENLYRVVDAFLQLSAPLFNAMIAARNNSDAVGHIFGEFLRDETAHYDRARLALSQQSILGIYRYEEVDTHQVSVEQDRYLCLLAGKNPDYVTLIDAPFDFEHFGVLNRSEKLKILSGFCIPGETFSPVIMRTLCFRLRQIGLLYTPGNLIDAHGGALDELTYEVFTTDKASMESLASKKKYGDPLFASVLNIHYGPKKRQTLTKLPDGDEKSKIINRIEKLRLSVL